MLSLVKQGKLIWMGPGPSETDTEEGLLQRQYAKIQCKSNRKFRDSLLLKWVDSEIPHRNKLSEGVCSEWNIKKILVIIELISRYTIPPCMGLPI